MGGQRRAPPRPDLEPARVRASSWLLLGGATAIAVVAILLFPASGGDSPPIASLALIGAVVAGATTPAIYVVARRDLGVPAKLAVPFAVAFVLIALVKFVLAPKGLYDVNAIKPLDDALGSIADPIGAVLTAAAVFALYLLTYWLVFRFGYGEPVRDRSPQGGAEGTAQHRTRSRWIVRGLLALGLVIAVVLTGGGLLVLALLLLNAPGQYVGFVLSSWAGGAIAVSLLVAAFLLERVFRRFEGGPELVANAGAAVTLFWLGFGFLALFHALWIVYVLVLGSIWPLKTVTPK